MHFYLCQKGQKGKKAMRRLLEESRPELKMAGPGQEMSQDLGFTDIVL